MTGNRYGILIANQDYAEDSGFHPLKCPLNDAAAVRDVLMDPEHGEFTEVRILPDKTRSEILLELEEALEQAEREDLIFIYFSGHGKTDRKGNLYFAASNTKSDRLRATGINGRDIADLIHEANVSKKALVLDCCYAGAMAKGFKGAADVAQDRVDEFAKGAGTYVLMATGELSLAAEDPEKGMSVLTRYLVEGLRGEADVNRDGIITLNELSRYVQKQVIHYHDQKPTEAGLGIQGEVAISKSGFEPEKDLQERIRAQLAAWVQDGVITFATAGTAEAVLNLGREPADPADRQRRALLDRVVQDSLKSGAFLEEWFQIPATAPEPEKPAEPPKPPKPAQKAKAEPAEKPKPSPKPKPAPPPGPESAAGNRASSSRQDTGAGPFGYSKSAGPGPAKKPGPEDGVTLSVAWILVGGAICLGLGILFDEYRITLTRTLSEDFASGILVGTVIGAVLCLRRLVAKRNKLGWFAKLVCWAGIVGFAGFGIVLASNMRF